MAYPNGKKTYLELDLQERWEWHSGVYAFRHVVLDQAIIAGTAPTDPEGKWFDRQMIDREVAKLRAKRARPSNATREEALRREGVALCNAYARQEGFADWDAAIAAGRDYSAVLQSIRAGLEKRRKAADYTPTAEQMAAGRAALGITEPGNLAELQGDLGVTATEQPKEEKTANA